MPKKWRFRKFWNSGCISDKMIHVMDNGTIQLPNWNYGEQSKEEKKDKKISF